MRFQPEKKDLLSTEKTKSAAKEQELGWEELSDEAAAAIRGGARYSDSNTSRPSTAEEYYNYAGYWGG